MRLMRRVRKENLRQDVTQAAFHLELSEQITSRRTDVDDSYRDVVLRGLHDPLVGGEDLKRSSSDQNAVSSFHGSLSLGRYSRRYDITEHDDARLQTTSAARADWDFESLEVELQIDVSIRSYLSLITVDVQKVSNDLKGLGHVEWREKGKTYLRSRAWCLARRPLYQSGFIRAREV